MRTPLPGVDAESGPVASTGSLQPSPVSAMPPGTTQLCPASKPQPSLTPDVSASVLASAHSNLQVPSTTTPADSPLPLVPVAASPVDVAVVPFVTASPPGAGSSLSEPQPTPMHATPANHPSLMRQTSFA